MSEEKIRTVGYHVSGDELVRKVKQIMHEGNIRRIIIKTEGGNMLLEFPPTIGVVGVVLLPMWAALDAAAARKIYLLAGLLVAAFLLFAATGCDSGARVGDLLTKSETVELGGAESVSVEIKMGAGELAVSGGADELLEATFTYNVDELDPEATYSNGNLVVQHDDVRGGIGTFFDLDDYRNEWDLRLNEDVPMEMSIDMGAGRSDLKLGSLALTRLDINAGAGDVDLDLSGSQSLNRLDFDMGAGKLTLDLTGDWQDDLDATIRGGLGELTLRLPRDVGVRIDVDTGIGAVDASGLTKDGDTYTNDAFGESDVTLNIEIDAGVGKINLDVE
jgi:hypothetical protein